MRVGRTGIALHVSTVLLLQCWLGSADARIQKKTVTVLANNDEYTLTGFTFAKGDLAVIRATGIVKWRALVGYHTALPWGPGDLNSMEVTYSPGRNSFRKLTNMCLYAKFGTAKYPIGDSFASDTVIRMLKSAI